MAFFEFKTRLITFILLVSILALSDVASGKAPEVFLSTDNGGLVRTNTFFCHDTIYVNFIPDEAGKEARRASVSWINPKGKEQNFAEQDFSDRNTVRVWFWLKLQPSFGGKFLKGLDPSFGMGEHIGMWRLKLRVNGELRKTMTFYVVC